MQYIYLLAWFNLKISVNVKYIYLPFRFSYFQHEPKQIYLIFSSCRGIFFFLCYASSEREMKFPISCFFRKNCVISNRATDSKICFKPQLYHNPSPEQCIHFSSCFESFRAIHRRAKDAETVRDVRRIVNRTSGPSKMLFGIHELLATTNTVHNIVQ